MSRGFRTTRALVLPRARSRALVVLACLCLWMGVGVLETLWPVQAAAQDGQARPSKKAQRSKKAQAKQRQRRKARARARRRAAAQQARPTQPRKQDEKGVPASPASAEGEGAETSADSEIVREGEREVKVMNFSGLDVEGRLKSPQLLYFVHRVRAEFDRPRLPHRSFLPELDRSTNAEELR